MTNTHHWRGFFSRVISEKKKNVLEVHYQQFLGDKVNSSVLLGGDILPQVNIKKLKVIVNMFIMLAAKLTLVCKSSSTTATKPRASKNVASTAP